MSFKINFSYKLSPCLLFYSREHEQNSIWIHNQSGQKVEMENKIEMETVDDKWNGRCSSYLSKDTPFSKGILFETLFFRVDDWRLVLI